MDKKLSVLILSVRETIKRRVLVGRRHSFSDLSTNQSISGRARASGSSLSREKEHGLSEVKPRKGLLCIISVASAVNFLARLCRFSNREVKERVRGGASWDENLTKVTGY